MILGRNIEFDFPSFIKDYNPIDYKFCIIIPKALDCTSLVEYFVEKLNGSGYIQTCLYYINFTHSYPKGDPTNTEILEIEIQHTLKAWHQYKSTEPKDKYYIENLRKSHILLADSEKQSSFIEAVNNVVPEYISRLVFISNLDKVIQSYYHEYNESHKLNVDEPQPLLIFHELLDFKEFRKNNPEESSRMFYVLLNATNKELSIEQSNLPRDFNKDKLLCLIHIYDSRKIITPMKTTTLFTNENNVLELVDIRVLTDTTNNKLALFRINQHIDQIITHLDNQIDIDIAAELETGKANEI